MANEMYPTGLGNKTVDYASAGTNFFNTFVDSRLKEIGEKRKKASEYEKKVLNAMSVQAIPELSGKLRDKHQEKIQGFKDELTSRLQKSGGKPTTADDIFIESKSAELQNNMLKDQTLLKQWVSIQRNLANPSFMKNVVNAEGYVRDTTKWYDGFMNGEEMDSPIPILMNNRRKISEYEYLAGNYASIFKELGQIGTAEIKDGKVTFTNETDRAAAREKLSSIVNKDSRYKNASVDEKQAIVDEIIPLVSRKDITEKPYTPPSGRSGSGTKPLYLVEEEGVVGSRKSKRLIDYKQPGVINPTGTATDVSTGEAVELDGLDAANLVKLDLDDGQQSLIIQMKTGAPLKSDNGDVLYINESQNTLSLSKQKESGRSMAQLESKKEELLKGRLEGDYDTIKDAKVVKEGNKLIIKGTASSVKKGFYVFSDRPKPKEISMELVTATDPKGLRTLALPLDKTTSQYVKKLDRVYVPRKVNGKTEQVQIKGLISQIEDNRLTGKGKKKEVGELTEMKW